MAKTKKQVGVRAGIEFEFAAHYKSRRPLRGALDSRLSRGCVASAWRGKKDVWTLGEDRSVCEDYRSVTDDEDGLELRTPVLNPEDKRHLKSIQVALSVCQKFGAHVTRSCGLHIHLSCTDGEKYVNLKLLQSQVEKAYRRLVDPMRRSYCRVTDPYDGKYCSVRHVRGNHIEVRILNGTLRFAEVKTYIRQVVKMYRASLCDDK